MKTFRKIVSSALFAGFLATTLLSASAQESTTQKAKEVIKETKEKIMGNDKHETDSQGVSKETRKQMADMHKKMADCLDSDRTLAECRKEMMENCPAKGKQDCMMMMEGRVPKQMRKK